MIEEKAPYKTKKDESGPSTRTSLYPNTFQHPNLYVDQLAHLLTAEEQAVLTKAVREILGWCDNAATRSAHISLSVFVKGKFSRKTGEQVAHGCGLGLQAVRKCLAVLDRYRILDKVGMPTQRGQRYTLQMDAEKIDWEGLRARKERRDDANRKRTEKATRRSLQNRGRWWTGREVTSDVRPGGSVGRHTEGVTSDVTPGVTSDVNNETQIETQIETQVETQNAADAVSESEAVDFSLPELQAELGAESKPAAEPVSRPASRFAGVSDPFALMAHCEAAQKAAGGDGDGKSWTVPPEAGGADSLGEAMLAAWLRAKGVVAGNVPDKLRARWENTLRKLARTMPDISTALAVQAVEVVLDRRGPNGWYNYADPAVEKFKRDWTDAVLALLSGNDPKEANALEPAGFAGIRQVGREEGWWG